eukprot:6189345-Pleurochrysis_carterae.AAC.1
MTHPRCILRQTLMRHPTTGQRNEGKQHERRVGGKPSGAVGSFARPHPLDSAHASARARVHVWLSEDANAHVQEDSSKAQVEICALACDCEVRSDDDVSARALERTGACNHVHAIKSAGVSVRAHASPSAHMHAKTHM